MIQKVFGWQPNTRLRDGMEKTYRWIYDQMVQSAAGAPVEKQLMTDTL